MLAKILFFGGWVAFMVYTGFATALELLSILAARTF